jgi:hypothetical protein
MKNYYIRVHIRHLTNDPKALTLKIKKALERLGITHVRFLVVNPELTGESDEQERSEGGSEG